MNQPDFSRPWGAYAPGAATLPFRLLIGMGLGRGRISQWIRRVWIRNISHIVDIERDGVKYRLDIHHNTTDAKILTSSKRYDGAEIQYLTEACSKPDSVFVDAGANTGYYTLALARRGCRQILSIEPNPPTLALLRFNVANNAFASHARIAPLCLGEAGKVALYCAGGLGGASIYQLAGAPEPVLVDSLPLLEVLRQNGVTKIDALKIDIEGAEDLALIPFFEAADKALWPGMVVIEHCHQEAWKTNVIDYMKRLGYREIGKTRGNLILRSPSPTSTP